ncbi:alpha/beta hydrolase [Natronospirillum operosum]|uniref:Alpha/beta hydrolase n=1 Tax=Natronospirillum operosum TaxID=2759953 RepID=A0A4Z0W972_9GAMM|nr:alpha/beta hydrolase [Natronospirillum operosum]TGG89980.1 alpha/beta hydrolase [Natronospirillum operosum]
MPTVARYPKTPLLAASVLSLTVLTACQSLPDPDPEIFAMPDTRTLQTNGGTLAYDLQGEGPLVVLLPGLGDLRQSYRFLAPELADAGYTVVTMDLRGHGETSVPWASYSTEDVSQDLLALIDHLERGPAAVVGNSFSAGVAVWAATEQPEAVTAISMIGPFVRDHEAGLIRRSVMGASMAVMFNGPWKVRSWLWFHGTLFTDEKPADHEQYRAHLHANLSEPHRFDAVKQMIDRSDAAVEARLPQVIQPTQIIMGTLDPDYADPAAEAEWIAERLNGQVALIEDAGHYPQAEKPAETLQALLPFLRNAIAAVQ